MSAEEHSRIMEEIAFWETNFFSISILKKVPGQVPDIQSVRTLLAKFMLEFDYHSIAHRLALLKRSLRTGTPELIAQPVNSAGTLLTA
jgi:hypothetical protein